MTRQPQRLQNFGIVEPVNPAKFWFDEENSVSGDEGNSDVGDKEKFDSGFEEKFDSGDEDKFNSGDRPDSGFDKNSEKKGGNRKPPWSAPGWKN